MKVFIVCAGESYEGYRIVGIYSSRRAAFTVARDYMAKNSWDNKNWFWQYNGRWSWFIGCDYVSIKTQLVQE